MAISYVVTLFLLHFISHFSFPLASTTTKNSNSEIPLAPPPQSLASTVLKPKESPAFKPSIAVIVGVFTIIFSLTFLLLLYAKHCRRGEINGFLVSNSRNYPPITAPKNSGVNRAVVESLPIFRFASLRGQKDGLECAVCLNRFDPTEVLRLLPKCKHAFHVECVDTWLDAHSTCPLCRYRVDPEDILLVEENRNSQRQSGIGIPSVQNSPAGVSRVSGRHSFAGNSLEVIVEAPRIDTATFIPRRSLDSWRNHTNKKKKNIENRAVVVGCFDKQQRKDGLLLADKTTGTNGSSLSEQRRLEHRIIISGERQTLGPLNQRWSDVHQSDLLFLKSEMILSESRRFIKSAASRSSVGGAGGGREETVNEEGSGRDVIKGRSVSEITGVSRYGSKEEEERRKRQEGAVSRWVAWISQSHFSN